MGTRLFATRLRRASLIAIILAAALLPAVSIRGQDPARDSSGHAPPGASPPSTDEALAAAARDGGFYLVLDPVEGSLSLRLSGAELRRFAVSTVQVGRPRVAFLRGRETPAWSGTWWREGQLAPARPVRRQPIDPAAADEGVETEVRIPPAPEEAYPAPSRYLVTFASGLALEVRPSDAGEASGADRLGTAWRTYLPDAWWAVRGLGSPAIRLRLTLTAEEAGALYRALPPEVGLVVLGVS